MRQNTRSRDRARRRIASLAVPVMPVTRFDAIRLVGSLGTHARPRLVSVVGSDPDNGDSTFSNGDKITLTFDMATHIGRMGITGDVDPFRPRTEASGGVTLTQVATRAPNPVGPCSWGAIRCCGI